MKKNLLLKLSLLFIVLLLLIPLTRSIIESYYIKYFTTIEIEPTEPTTKNLKISYYAKKQIGVTTSYDGSYVNIPYPKGDVALSTGVCTDVVIRALRPIGIDLQQLMHEDMKLNFKDYPNYGLAKPDSNIDHRRVPNIRKYFENQGYSLPITDNEKDYKPGDIVTWNFSKWNHIGVVSNIKKKWTDRYYIVHNSYKGTELSDWLFMSKITGHYRVK